MAGLLATFTATKILRYRRCGYSGIHKPRTSLRDLLTKPVYCGSVEASIHNGRSRQHLRTPVSRSVSLPFFLHSFRTTTYALVLLPPTPTTNALPAPTLPPRVSIPTTKRLRPQQSDTAAPPVPAITQRNASQKRTTERRTRRRGLGARSWLLIDRKRKKIKETEARARRLWRRRQARARRGRRHRSKNEIPRRADQTHHAGGRRRRQSRTSNTNRGL